MSNNSHGAKGSVKAPMMILQQIAISFFLDYDVHIKRLILHQFIVSLAKGPPLTNKICIYLNGQESTSLLRRACYNRFCLRIFPIC
jgi:hypothetical protein